MPDPQPRFKREGEGIMILVEGFGWVHLGPAEDVMAEMADFLGQQDFEA